VGDVHAVSAEARSKRVKANINRFHFRELVPNDFFSQSFGSGTVVLKSHGRTDQKMSQRS